MWLTEKCRKNGKAAKRIPKLYNSKLRVWQLVFMCQVCWKRESEGENEAISAFKGSVLCKIALHQCFQTLIRISVDFPEMRKSIFYFCGFQGAVASPISLPASLNPPCVCPVPNMWVDCEDTRWMLCCALCLPEAATRGLNVLQKVPVSDTLSCMDAPLESVIKSTVLWKKRLSQ